jgi:hypothetical protein
MDVGEKLARRVTSNQNRIAVCGKATQPKHDYVELEI